MKIFSIILIVFSAALFCVTLINRQNTNKVVTSVDIKENLMQTDKNIKETMADVVEIQKIIKKLGKELKVYENRH